MKEDKAKVALEEGKLAAEQEERCDPTPILEE